MLSQSKPTDDGDNSRKESQTLNNSEKPGLRLNVILDHAGYQRGRGRIQMFHKFLTENLKEELGEISYSTIQSWFNQAAPPMTKINPVIDKLNESACIDEDITKVKLWWKMGGESPFTKSPLTKQKFTRQQSAKVDIETNYYIRQYCGDDFDQFDAVQLTAIIDKVNQLAEDFANPDLVDAPKDLLRLMVMEEVRKLKS